MLQIDITLLTALRAWFQPEQPGPLIGMHIIQTGHGKAYVDRWPDPRAILVGTGDNYSLSGEADALQPADLPPDLRGFVEARDAFVPLLESAYPELHTWDRVILSQPAPSSLDSMLQSQIRRLGLADLEVLNGLGPGLRWISVTWDDPEGLAASGLAWGAFVKGRLAAVACPFFQGEIFEDIGVVTEPEHRRQGLSSACAGALCADIWARGRRPSWSTSPDNLASLRVAEKLGFVLDRRDRLYVVGMAIPETEG
jgi:GNAT superfamily N-acetyltransferase